MSNLDKRFVVEEWWLYFMALLFGVSAFGIILVGGYWPYFLAATVASFWLLRRTLSRLCYITIDITVEEFQQRILNGKSFRFCGCGTGKSVQK